MNLIVRYKKLSRKEKKLFFRAFRCLFVAFLKTTFLPMKKYIRAMGTENMVAEYVPDEQTAAFLGLLKQSIRRTAKYAPFKSKCLQQAYAGKMILNHEKIPSTIYFGVAKDEKGGLKAHAWLKSGDFFVSGGKESPAFTVVSFFS